MEDENKTTEFHITHGVFDLICKDIREKIAQESKKEGVHGIGVLTDRYCEEELLTHPLKTLEQRMKIAESLEGVDFVFPLNEITKMQEEAEKAYLEYKRREEENKRRKRYKVGFVIGSFDVFHSGHLENINEAKQICERLFIVLKSDERIIKNKGKIPQQSTAERAEILKCLKQVENVLYMDIDTTREDVLEEVMKMAGNIEKSDIVAIFGSDLKEKEEPHTKVEWKDINVEFTYRDPNKMGVISSSNYQEKCIESGGIETIEGIEKSALGDLDEER